MSTCFEIFPTLNEIPKCADIIELSLELFNSFLRRNNLKQPISVSVSEVKGKEVIDKRPQKVITEEGKHQIFDINREGEVFLFYHKNTELDECLWNDEIKSNINAKQLNCEIARNLKVGYSWCVKKLMSQPPVVCLYYGYIAIAIAVLTNGIIFSGDGAWEYGRLPIMGREFINEYLNIESLNDKILREKVITWIKSLE